jgi:hypothetical protein
MGGNSCKADDIREVNGYFGEFFGVYGETKFQLFSYCAVGREEVVWFN